MGKQRTSTCPGKDKLFDELANMVNVKKSKIAGPETFSEERQVFTTKMRDLCRACSVEKCSRREEPFLKEEKTEDVPDTSKK